MMFFGRDKVQRKKQTYFASKSPWQLSFQKLFAVTNPINYLVNRNIVQTCSDSNRKYVFRSKNKFLIARLVWLCGNFL